MKVFAEKEAEKFLKKQEFEILEGFFVNSTLGVQRALKKLGLPCVMKVFSRKILHKAKLGGVRLNIRTYSEALSVFKDLKKIKNAQGVLIQKVFPGKEFLLGIKKTPEFEHSLVFGAGGSKVEEKKDVSFRVCPIDKKDVRSMIKETKIGKRLPKKGIEVITGNLFKLCKLVKKYPKISELDLNPFTISKGQGKIIDARIVFK